MTRISIALLTLALAAPVSAQPTRSESERETVARGLEVWRQRHGPSWAAVLDANTGRLEFLYGGASAPSRIPVEDGDFVALALESVAATASMHGIAADELVLEGVHFLPLAQIGSTDKIAVNFAQLVRGIRVHAGSLNCLFDMRGRLLSLHAQGVVETSRLELAPTVPSERARSIAVAAFESDEHEVATEVSDALLEITRSGGGALAWRVEVGHRTEGAVPAGRVYWIGAQDGVILGTERTVHDFEVRGTVRAFVTPGFAPDSASNSEVATTMRYLDVTSSAGTVRTDASGNFVFPSVNTSLQVTARFTGTYNNVQNSAGTEYSLTQTIPPNQDNTLTMNPSSSAQVTAQGNVFHHVNLLRDFVRSIVPTDATADFLMSANVNINDSCNAYFDGGSTNYFLPGGSCVNTAYSTVVSHENGHWLNVRYNTGNGPDGMGEGNADVWAMYLYDTPIVGQDFCGAGCAIRSGQNTRLFCGDASPACHGGVHADGEPWMGAAWKIRARLNTALGNSMGDLTANTLFLSWMGAYNQSQIRSIIETQWVVLDDDDGDINDGSPHFAQIDGGFRDQGFPGLELHPVTIEFVTIVPDTEAAVGPYGIEASILEHFDGASITSATMFWRSNGASFTALPFLDQGNGRYGQSIPPVVAPAQVDYYIVASDSLGNSVRWPSPTGAQGFRVGTAVPLLAYDFESGPEGWTHGSYGDTSNSSDDWEHGDPTGESSLVTSGGQLLTWYDPSNAPSGTKCFGTDLGITTNGAYPANAHTWLRSPLIDCSTARGTRLTFRRWLTIQSGAADQARIRVNGNIVWSNSTQANLLEGAWSVQTVDISTFADANPAVQIEFELRTDAAVNMGGWNVDVVTLTQLGPATSACTGPTAYGPAKLHSGGGIATLIVIGDTSFSAGGFTLRIESAVPLRPAMLYSSSASAATSLLGGTLLIAQPFAREIAWQTDALGDASANYAVHAGLVGTTRFYQAVFRDPAHPDATGIGFSKALRIPFCP
mgnify:CR=1 FL=1